MCCLGGVTWGSCTGTPNPNSEAWPARKDTTAFFDSQGYLYISAGLNQYFNALSSTDITYQAYSDFWKSTISFYNVPAVSQACNVPIRACGTGIQWSGITRDNTLKHRYQTYHN
jgi:hypothetical protein